MTCCYEAGSSTSTRKLIRRAGSVAVLLLTSALSLTGFAQVERATITGTLTDKNGAIVPDATVRVTDESTNETKTLQTDSAGEYVAGNLTPGSYTIEAEKTGFTKHINKGYVVQVGQTARLDIVMEVGSRNPVGGGHRDASCTTKRERCRGTGDSDDEQYGATAAQRKKHDPARNYHSGRYRIELCPHRDNRFRSAAGRTAPRRHDHRSQWRPG